MNTAVTLTGDTLDHVSSAAQAAANRDKSPGTKRARARRRCESCGRRIVGVMCFFEARSLGPYCEGCAAQALRSHDRRLYEEYGGEIHNTDGDGYDPFHTRLGCSWDPRPCAVCGQLVRGLPDRFHARCSEGCRRELPTVVRRERRRRARESEIPESFACVECDEEIEGTVVFWDWDKARCEPCYVTVTIRKARELHGEYGHGPFGALFPNPDASGWSPYRSWQEVVACGHCGRPIRGWRGFCCDRCKHEAEKTARRIPPEEKFCLMCGEPFTPKRSDAVTCSDRCRQAKRRMGLVTDSRVYRAARAAEDAANRDITEAD